MWVMYLSIHIVESGGKHYNSTPFLYTGTNVIVIMCGSTTTSMHICITHRPLDLKKDL